MRPNAVDAIYDKNTGNNLGGDDFPYIHFEEVEGEALTIELMLKGGGCENVGAQYSLPDNRLGAGRDLAGVRKVVLDAVHKAQGQGCAPGILGVAIGGDRGTGYVKSKEVLFDKLGTRNPDPKLAELEEQPDQRSQPAGHRPDGLRRPDDGHRHQDHRPAPPAGLLLRHHLLHVLGLPPPQDDRSGRSGQLRLTGGHHEIEYNIPIQDDVIRALKVGDPLLLTGVMITGRDTVHKWMIETFIKKTRPPQGDDLEVYEALKPILDGGIIYHCGPVVSGLDTKQYKFVAAGPTTSIREEPYQADVMKHFNLKGVIGKGGMGARTLKGCQEVPGRLLARHRRRGHLHRPVRGQGARRLQVRFRCPGSHLGHRGQGFPCSGDDGLPRPVPACGCRAGLGRCSRNCSASNAPPRAAVRLPVRINYKCNFVG